MPPQEQPVLAPVNTLKLSVAVGVLLFVSLAATAVLLFTVPAGSKSNPASAVATSTSAADATSTPGTEATSTSAEGTSPSYYLGLLTPTERAAALAAMGTTSPHVITGGAYRIFVVSSSDFPYYSSSSPTDWYDSFPIRYVDDGIIASGTYAGWHRVIAEFPPGAGDMGDSYTYFTFATKDYKTFVLHTSHAGLVPDPGWFNTKVVVGAANFPVNFPSTVAMGNFTLVQGDFGSTTDSYNRALDTQASPAPGVQPLGSARGLQFFPAPTAVRTDLELYLSNVGSTTATATLATAQHYIASPTMVIARDSAGVAFLYSLSFTNFADSNNPLDQKPPNGPGIDPYRYGDLEVDPARSNLYTSYGALFSEGCGISSSYSYALKNISSNDVRDTGVSWQGVELYTLADSNSPLTRIVYDLKRWYAANPDQALEVGSTSLTLSRSAYVQKSPILLFKDPWGRWIAVGEQQYYLAQGCGKPVLYLYPTVPTDVSVTFKQTPRFAVDIPAYVSPKGWNVRAQPDGELHDLQPQLTDCSAINTAAFGSAYAKSACASGIYPYLYWSGVVGRTYPSPTGGWIVARGNVENFLWSKLQLLGLSQKERGDMLSFWVPELLKINVPYYRLSFFQTAQMNAFIPMKISPRPDSLLRVFLDWTPLSAPPAHAPKPEVLHPFQRNGFTVVEWGGLER